MDSSDEVEHGEAERAAERAAAVFEALDTHDPRGRASLMYRMAAALENGRGPIVATAVSETSLNQARLEGELDRTAAQLRIYADALVGLVEAEEARMVADEAPTIVRTMSGIGPVANLEASNFPLAFGALGTDTASAFAAGCPVVVKTHPAHPRTSELCVAIAEDVLAGVGLGSAISLVHGGVEVARRLVLAEPVAAVTFTGSPSGGRALIDLAASRTRPIPVYAEMGSINPIIVTEGALAESECSGLARLIVDSVTGSAGQLCTKPGIVFVPMSPRGDDLVSEIEEALSSTGPFEFIDERIASRFEDRTREVAQFAGRVRRDGGTQGAWLFEDTLGERQMIPHELVGEIFGPASVVIRYSALSQVVEVLEVLGGQLAIALHATESEGPMASHLAGRLLRFAGRIVWCGVPTGVAVVEAMHHGGPWPASNSIIGSVGPEAIRRFRRSVTWQGFPASAMPRHLRPGDRS